MWHPAGPSGEPIVGDADLHGASTVACRRLDYASALEKPNMAEQSVDLAVQRLAQCADLLAMRRTVGQMIQQCVGVLSQ